MKLLETHDDLVVVGATIATDPAMIQDFRQRTGATYPMLHGLEAEAKAAWEIEGYPALRVVDRRGRIVGSTLEDLEGRLDG